MKEPTEDSVPVGQGGSARQPGKYRRKGEPGRLRALTSCATLFLAVALALPVSLYIASFALRFLPRWLVGAVGEIGLMAASALLAVIIGWLSGAFLPLPPTAKARRWSLLLPLVLAMAGTCVYLVLTMGSYFNPPVSLYFSGAAIVFQAVGSLLFGLGFFLKARKRPPLFPSSKAGIRAPLFVLLAVAAAGGGLFFFAYGEALSDEELYQGHGIDINAYLPGREGNRLVTPDVSPSLRIARNHPRLDGAIALLPVYASAANAVYDMAKDGAAPSQGNHELDGDEAGPLVACSNTQEAFMRLVLGEIDIFFGVQPSAGLLEMAESAGLSLVYTPIGREAFVFFVNPRNPVDNLTEEQVRDIYTKRTTNWREVGGPNRSVLAFQRPENSGSQSVMRSLVMKGEPMAQPLREEYMQGMGDIINEAASYRNSERAIGFSFRWYATVQYGERNIRLLSVNGVAPDVDNIRSGRYPFAVDLYAITARPLSRESKALLDWITGSEGQALVAKVGYVPLEKTEHP